MRAVVRRKTGGPEVLEVQEWPEPRREPGQVLVRNEAITVPLYETQLRAGIFGDNGEAAVFGHESAGVVVEADDDDLVGRRVASMSFTGGAYAEYVATQVEGIALVPDGLSSVEATAAAVPASVALSLMKVANLTGGETVLVEAASGAIGGSLVRLAIARGARVIATAGTGREVKADLVLDHNDPAWRTKLPSGIDVVFESIGGPRSEELLDKLVPGEGRILFYGQLSGERPSIGIDDLVPHGLTLVACTGLTGFAKKVRDSREEALRLVADGTLPVAIDRTYPLEDVAAAHERVESRQGNGKVVLVP